MRAWRGMLAGMTAWVLIGAGTAQACGDTHVRLRADNAGKVSRAAVCLINKRRAKAGLKRLKQDKELRAAADAHSADMVAQRYFDHDGPSGDTPVTRAERAGYLSQNQRSWALAENIAYGVGGGGTAAAIVRDWMASPGHRANILTASSRDAGVGLATGTPDGQPGATFTLDLGYAR